MALRLCFTLRLQAWSEQEPTNGGVRSRSPDGVDLIPLCDEVPQVSREFVTYVCTAGVAAAMPSVTPPHRRHERPSAARRDVGEAIRYGLLGASARVASQGDGDGVTDGMQ